MRPRTIAIGDIHGCSRALEAVLTAIGPRPDDVIVTLGDYVNRGPDSRAVLDRLIALEGQCTLVPILGNHDQMLLAAAGRRATGILRLCWRWGVVLRLRRTAPGGSPKPIWRESRPNTSRSSGDAASITRPRRTSSSTLNTTRTCPWRINLRSSCGGSRSATSPPVRTSPARGRSSAIPRRSRRDPRPRPPGLHRHILLRRRLADGAGRPYRGGLAGESGGRTAPPEFP